jgi:myo-inositol-1(or 4)-monophosphatase
LFTERNRFLGLKFWGAVNLYGLEDCLAREYSTGCVVAVGLAAQDVREVMSDYKQVAERAARAGGDVLRDWFGRIEAREKSPKDLVTQADLASQQVIQEIVMDAFPDHLFLGEEDAAVDSGAPQADLNSDSWCWVVDPLDGTVNYVHGLQSFAVSVALMQGGQPRVGVVYDPLFDECFSAEQGQGAEVNGTVLKASDCQLFEQAVVVASFPPNVQRGAPEIEQFIEILHQSQTLRRLGSAALNLCYLAAGRLDAYWATSPKAWDIAAGVLIAQEAGAVVSDLAGLSLDWEKPRLAAAATPALHQQLLDILASVSK